MGYIKLKNLLAFKFSQHKSLNASGIVLHTIRLNENLTLLDAIDQLKQKRVNFAIVVEEGTDRATGMITLKKIFEKLVLKEFQDDDHQLQFNWTMAENREVEEGREQD